MYLDLHARSAFSFLRGGSTPEDLAERAARLEMPAMAVCDRDGVYGAPRFYSAARERGVRPIVGCELTLEDQSVLPVLVESRAGYQNLCRLVTRAQLRSPKGASRVAWQELEEFSSGLVALTGDAEGPLQQALANGQRGQAGEALDRLARIFGPGRLYVELQRHGVRGERRRNADLIGLAESRRLPLLATNGVAYATPEGREILDAFTCIRHHTHLDAAGALLSPNAERYLKSPRQMAALFADIPEAVANTRRLADRLAFTLQNLGYEFPAFPVPEGETMDSYLRRMTYEGARRRYGAAIGAAVKEQLEKELGVISRLQFSGYFLIVWDLVRFAQDNDIFVQGRGSSANSTVCYCLGITNADPIRYKLLFERFLNEDRGFRSWPDIDLDLPSGDRREKVIQEVYRRYGKHGAAMTANVITYRGRSAMREIGKALNFPPETLDRFSSLFASGDFPHTMELPAQLEHAGISARHPRLAAAVSLYQKIYGLPRHLGQHSGGMIICLGQLNTIVPLENASMPGRVVAQWDKDDCEDLGIIKVDLLGLGMMSVLQDAFALCRQRGPERELDIAKLPDNDPATYEAMQKADTIGVFQIESRAQMATLPRMKPKDFYDLVIEVAIIRPGPIVGDLLHPYLGRRAKKLPETYMDERLRPVLERTLGVPLFQEQMLQIAMIMADFTGGEADEMRRAIGFQRDDKRLKKVIEKLRAGMERKGIPLPTQEEVIKAANSFALYGFPESHAISFALLAYASAYLKTHRLPEFTASLLNNQPMGFYSPATILKDARRHGLQIRPVSVLHSDWLATVESDHAIRLGLRFLNGLRETAGRRIVGQRLRQPFASLDDFLRRAALNQQERRILAKAGALNGLCRHRREALWQVESPADREDWFTRPDAGEGSPLAPMTPLERLQADYQAMDATTGPHPMAFARDRLPGITLARDLAATPHGRKLRIAGQVICRQRPGTAKGHVFISLEDETGVSNAFVASPLFEKSRVTITHEPFLVIEGILQKIDNVISITATRILPLPDAPLPSTDSHDFR